MVEKIRDFPDAIRRNPSCKGKGAKGDVKKRIFRTRTWMRRERIFYVIVGNCRGEGERVREREKKIRKA